MNGVPSKGKICIPSRFLIGLIMGFVGNKQKDKFSEKEGGHEYPEHPPPPLGTTLF